MTARPFEVRRLVGAVWSHYLALFGLLIAAALLVFVPVSLIDAIVGPFSEAGDDARAGEVVGAIAAVLAGSAVSLIGGVIYAGIVSSIVGHHQGVHNHPLRQALKSLPYARLIAADACYFLLIAVGLIFLIIPGLVLLTWFALVAPVVEMEDRTVRGALRRSRELVRPHFWKLFIVVVPLNLASELISGLLSDSSIAVFGETFTGDWAGAVLGEVVTAPFLALFVVLAFRELRSR